MEQRSFAQPIIDGHLADFRGNYPNSINFNYPYPMGYGHVANQWNGLSGFTDMARPFDFNPAGWSNGYGQPDNFSLGQPINVGQVEGQFVNCHVAENSIYTNQGQQMEEKHDCSGQTVNGLQTGPLTNAPSTRWEHVAAVRGQTSGNDYRPSDDATVLLTSHLQSRTTLNLCKTLH